MKRCGVHHRWMLRAADGYYCPDCTWDEVQHEASGSAYMPRAPDPETDEYKAIRRERRRRAYHEDRGVE